MKLFNKKFLKYSAVSCFTVFLIAGLTSLFLWWNGVRKNDPVETVGQISLSPSGDRLLGSSVEASVLFKAPWHRHPAEASAIPGKGSQLLDKPSWKIEKIRPTFRIWKVSVELQSYRIGKIPSGSLDVSFNKEKSDSPGSSFKFNIPAFDVKPLDAGASPELTLAAAAVIKSKISNAMLFTILAGAGLLVTGLLILIDLIRRSRKKAVRPPTAWELALAEIEDTAASLRAGSITPVFCFSRLTDIVRSYVQTRFRLRATVQTTYEFLSDLRHPASPLNESQKFFLQDFLTSADLVKFAALPPDAVILENMLNKAGTLVRETIPNEAGEKMEEHKK
ncbi:MAG: hypothetical protein A2020_08220 [Lentisphaerae bacterium GWF2_45_14]|nr:MAG: hypothetical protein A2020_08220 [Lentisphaerae bacterium GWF2_45_14]